MKHTKEPWEVWNGDDFVRIVAMRGSYNVVKSFDNCESDAANAARIVACVNFLAMIPNELLTLENSEIVKKLLLK